MDYEQTLQRWVLGEGGFPISERIIFAYVLDPTLTASELAEKIGTSATTILKTRGRLVRLGRLVRTQHTWPDWSFTPA